MDQKLYDKGMELRKAVMGDFVAGLPLIVFGWLATGVMAAAVAGMAAFPG